MAMVFCRGCSKSLHASALTCPHCGAVQGVAPTNRQVPQAPHWSALSALFAGVMCITLGLTVQANRWNQTLNAGTIALSCIALATGIWTLTNQLPGRKCAITGIVLGSFVLLILLSGS